MAPTLFPNYLNESITDLVYSSSRVEAIWNGGVDVASPQQTLIMPLSPPSYVANVTGVPPPIPANLDDEPQALLLQTGASNTGK